MQINLIRMKCKTHYGSCVSYCESFIPKSISTADDLNPLCGSTKCLQTSNYTKPTMEELKQTLTSMEQQQKRRRRTRRTNGNRGRKTNAQEQPCRRQCRRSTLTRRRTVEGRRRGTKLAKKEEGIRKKEERRSQWKERAEEETLVMLGVQVLI